MDNEQSEGTAIPGMKDYFSSGTSGSPQARKVGFEQQWQTGWQSVTSASIPIHEAFSSVTMAQLDQIADTLPIKRARRIIQWFKVG